MLFYLNRLTVFYPRTAERILIDWSEK